MYLFVLVVNAKDFCQTTTYILNVTEILGKDSRCLETIMQHFLHQEKVMQHFLINSDRLIISSQKYIMIISHTLVHLTLTQMQQLALNLITEIQLSAVAMGTVQKVANFVSQSIRRLQHCKILCYASPSGL